MLINMAKSMLVFFFCFGVFSNLLYPIVKCLESDEVTAESLNVNVPSLRRDPGSSLKYEESEYGAMQKDISHIADVVMLQLRGKLLEGKQQEENVIQKGSLILAISNKNSKMTESVNENVHNPSAVEFYLDNSRPLSGAAKFEETISDYNSSNLNIRQNSKTQVVRSYRVLRNLDMIVVDFNPHVSKGEVESTIKDIWFNNSEVHVIEPDTAVNERSSKNLRAPLSEDIDKLVRDEFSNILNFDNLDFSKISTLENDFKDLLTTRGVYDTIQKNNSMNIFNNLLKTLSTDLTLPVKQGSMPLSVINDSTILSSNITPNSDVNLYPELHNNAVHPEQMYNKKTKDIGMTPKTNQLFPNDSFFQKQWYLHDSDYTRSSTADVNAPEAWNLIYRLNGTPKVKFNEILVAHIDTGVDTAHPDVRDSLWVNPGEIPNNNIDDDGNGYIDDVHGWNFDGENGDVTDTNGHGTHTAGLIAAQSNNGKGVAGSNWSTKLVVLKFRSYISQAVAAIEYALDNNIRISSNSWGYSTYSTILDMALRKTYEKNHLFICAVDNQASNNRYYDDYPPNLPYPNILTVASTTKEATLNPTSNYGMNVDVAAPGKKILSTVPRWLDNIGYAYKDGTSMATPLVSGLASLMMSLRPDLTIYEIKQIIKETVTPLSALKGKIETEGIVNFQAAIQKTLGVTVTSAPAVNPTENTSYSNSLLTNALSMFLADV